ncbi:hypothetical protein-putative related to sulfatases [hydrothermal vent metagenome]|uniref:Sulfatase n=1 Tax=hydrothermal vent metagenome TaxID=652676 RepID=A0A3B1DN01_9ZZZZ
MSLFNEYHNQITRRHFFKQGGLGLGTAALGSLLGNSMTHAKNALPELKRSGGIPSIPHFQPKAKRAIYLFMAGAPSQLDTYDYKPTLEKMYNKDLPDSVSMGQRKTTMTSGQKRFPLAPSIFKFKQHGKSGAWLSELLPHTAGIVDDIAIVKSVHTEAINHDPAITYICTGTQLPGKPSLGSWLSYGLGSMNEDLPAFVVLTSTWTGRKEAQALYNRLWGAGILPGKYSGVSLRSQGDPVLFLKNPKGVSVSARRRMLDTLGEMNKKRLEEVGDPEIQTRITQYEMAFRMQTSVPELIDFSKETKATLDMYGPDVHKPGTFAYHCLLCRRMAERGVRFSQIFHRGWDQHAALPKDFPNQCKDIDQPSAALVKDLKQRGMLDDTLVIWGGEFGRTVYCQGGLTKKNYGRDHHPKCFSVWMAGGGIKGGIVHGETDDFSYNIVKDPVHIHDLNATILNRLGIDNQKMSIKYQGLDWRMTSVYDATLIKDILL